MYIWRVDMKNKLQKGTKIVNSDTIVSLILVADIQDNQLEYRKVRLGQALGNEFKKNVRDYLSSLEKDISEGLKELRDYSPGYKADIHEVEFIDIQKTEHNSLKLIIDSMPEITNIRFFDKDETSFTNKLSYYIISLANTKGEEIKIYRKYNSKKELTRSKQFAAYFKDGAYEKYEDKLFLFDEKVDCFLVDTGMFIENTYYFQLIFKYFEGLRNRAESILETIEDKIPIANIVEFKETCTGQLQMLAKLNNISSSSYFNTITLDSIKKTIEAYKLDVKIIEENGTEKLVYEKTDRWALLRLLDDDYLGSIMTEKQYVVNSKKSI
jgi:hypothetical protein